MSISTSTSTSSFASISPPSHNTRSRSKRKSLDKENIEPNVDATAAVTEEKTQTNKSNTKNKKRKTSAASSSSDVADDEKDISEEDTARARFERYLEELNDKYPNHYAMVLESLPQDEESDASYQDYDKLPRIIIPRSAFIAYEEFHQQVLDAIDCSDGFIVTWSSHSLIMLRLLDDQLTTFNMLSRQIHRSPTIIIPQALNLLFATSMVMIDFDFYYIDTEEPEICDEMAKEILKGAWTRLLKRSDRELGFVEPRTRIDLKRFFNQWYTEIHETIQERNE